MSANWMDTAKNRSFTVAARKLLLQRRVRDRAARVSKPFLVSSYLSDSTLAVLRTRGLQCGPHPGVAEWTPPKPNPRGVVNGVGDRGDQGLAYGFACPVMLQIGPVRKGISPKMYWHFAKSRSPEGKLRYVGVDLTGG